MLKYFRKVQLYVLCVLVCMLLVACSGESSTEEASSPSDHWSNASDEEITTVDEVEGGMADDREEVTLTIMIGDNDWVDFVDKSLPHINIETFQGEDNSPEYLQELIAAGSVPDLVTEGASESFWRHDSVGLTYALDEFMKENNFNVSRLNEAAVFYATEYDSVNDDNNGEWLSMPYEMRTQPVIYYNKKVFDTFGVNYPEDNMTIEEIFSLARQLTGERDGTHYYGLKMGNPIEFFTDGRPEQMIDPDTDDVRFLKDPTFLYWAEMLDQFWSIPGIIMMEDNRDMGHGWGSEDHFEEGHIAINRSIGSLDRMLEFERDGLINFNVVTTPLKEDSLGYGHRQEGPAIAIMSTSEHKEEAWEVIEFMLTDEFQERRTRDGYYTVLANPDIQEQLFLGLDGAEEKNLEAFYSLEPGTHSRSHMSQFPRSHVAPEDVLRDNMYKMSLEGWDPVEYLRYVTEVVEEQIRDYKAQIQAK